jgi:translation initiation factor 2B subunit (eIF-2B alpha/beta/delta family)
MESDLYRDRLQDLANDRVSGAREIVSRLISLLQASLRGEDGEGGRARILEAARVVVPKQPTMAPLLHTFDRLFREGTVPAGPATALNRLAEEHHGALDRVVATALPRLEEVESIATLSWSSTVARVLEKSGRRLRVVVAESRPGCEGRRAAARAAAHGHLVTFHPDSWFPRAAASTDLLMLGGDALTPAGLVNKVGSLSAARECRERNVPVVALLDALKVVGATLSVRLRVLPENAAEVWDNPPQGVEVHCRYFELVPLDLLSAVWGETDETDPLVILDRVAGESPGDFWNEVPPPEAGVPLD